MGDRLRLRLGSGIRGAGPVLGDTRHAQGRLHPRTAEFLNRNRRARTLPTTWVRRSHTDERDQAIGEGPSPVQIVVTFDELLIVYLVALRTTALVALTDARPWLFAGSSAFGALTKGPEKRPGASIPLPGGPKSLRDYSS
jgi:hypothetical protein